VVPTPHDRVVALARRQDDVVTRVQAHQLGLSESALVLRRRRDGWVSPVRGALLVPPVRDPIRARSRAVLAVAGGVICGLTAARLHGLSGLPLPQSSEPIELAVPSGDRLRERRGYLRFGRTLREGDVVDLGGLRATSTLRTLEDLALLRDRELVISVIDAMLHERRMKKSDLAVVRDRVLAHRDGGRTRTWWELNDGAAESPLETRLRLLLGDAGLLPEETQWPVRDPRSGRLVARVDFAWPSVRLAVEADGAGPHGLPAALHRDRIRQNNLVRAGWKLLRFTWWDVSAAPAALLRVVRDALAQAAARERGGGASSGGGGASSGGGGELADVRGELAVPCQPLVVPKDEPVV